MKHKAWLSVVLAALLVISMTACGKTAADGTVPSEQPASDAESPESAAAESAAQEAAEPEPFEITLSGDSITAPDAVVNGTVVTIVKGGDYRISGTLNDGQIIVDAGGEDDVRLILDGADITCTTSAPIYVKKADLVNIWVTEGTENTVTDGAKYVLAEGEDEPDAAIFSKDDLAIVQGGSLTVHGNYDMGIHSKDSLMMASNITVDAVGDGVKGKDEKEAETMIETLKKDVLPNA